MDEIGDIIETNMNINIGVHGNFIIKRNEGIFKNIYEKTCHVKIYHMRTTALRSHAIFLTNRATVRWVVRYEIGL